MNITKHIITLSITANIQPSVTGFGNHLGTWRCRNIILPGLFFFVPQPDTKPVSFIFTPPDKQTGFASATMSETGLSKKTNATSCIRYLVEFGCMSIRVATHVVELVKSLRSCKLKVT